MTDNSINPDKNSELVVEEHEESMRLDTFLTARFPHLTRAKIQRAVGNGCARVDNSTAKSSLKLKAGQNIAFAVPVVVPDRPIPEDIPLDIIYEDDQLIGINKPPFMVVHPAKGHWSGTLTAALAFHFDQLSTIGGATRPGIVHRLDRDTSGIIIVAKTDFAHTNLSKQFEARTVQKTYCAIVAPPPDRDRDHIEQPIGVHPYQREKMAIRRDHKTSRQATTFYEVTERAGRFAKVSVSPKTGRTHQIRVHLAHIGSPVVSDKLYSGHNQLIESDIVGPTGNKDVILDRQALHAMSIQFKHPVSNEDLRIESPLADDLAKAWNVMKNSSLV